MYNYTSSTMTYFLCQIVGFTKHIISKYSQQDTYTGPASPLFPPFVFLQLLYKSISQQLPPPLALITQLTHLQNHTELVVSHACSLTNSNSTITLVATSFQAFSFTLASLYALKFTCHKEMKGFTASISFSSLSNSIWPSIFLMRMQQLCLTYEPFHVGTYLSNLIGRTLFWLRWNRLFPAWLHWLQSKFCGPT